MTVKKNDKNFIWEDHWAQSITRARHGEKEYLFAYVRRQHSYDDINMDGEGTWIGLVETPIYRMEVDNDEESPTYGDRVPLEYKTNYEDGHIEKQKVIKGHKYEYIYEATKINMDKFKKLYGTTIQGTTELLWLVGRKPYTCPYDKDFWTKTLEQVQTHILKQRSISVDKD